MKFAVALNKTFRMAGETTQAFAAQLKALTQKDKEELHAIMVADGMDVEPPRSAETVAA